MTRRVRKPDWPADLTPYVVETLTLPYFEHGDRAFPLCEIKLIDCEGTWSFSFKLNIELYSHWFPSMPSYRRAFPDRESAFQAARAEVQNDVNEDWTIRRWKGPRPKGRRVLAWIGGLQYETQLTLDLRSN